PTARNAIAWASGPGSGTFSSYRALKARDETELKPAPSVNHFALSALRVSLPGPLAQAVTFRAFGAANPDLKLHSTQAIAPTTTPKSYRIASANVCLPRKTFTFFTVRNCRAVSS